jgi:hypothetical protein
VLIRLVVVGILLAIKLADVKDGRDVPMVELAETTSKDVLVLELVLSANCEALDPVDDANAELVVIGVPTEVLDVGDAIVGELPILGAAFEEPDETGVP